MTAFLVCILGTGIGMILQLVFEVKRPEVYYFLGFAFGIFAVSL